MFKQLLANYRITFQLLRLPCKVLVKLVCKHLSRTLSYHLPSEDLFSIALNFLQFSKHTLGLHMTLMPTLKFLPHASLGKSPLTDCSKLRSNITSMKPFVTSQTVKAIFIPLPMFPPHFVHSTGRALIQPL